VIYSGSIERIDFGEEHEPKGFVVAEISDEPTTWEFVRGYRRQARPFVTVRADVRDAVDPTAAVVAAIHGRTGPEPVEGSSLADTVVRVIVKLRQEQEVTLVEREISKALEGAYFVAALQKEVERTERQRLGAVSVEALTPAQLLERYLQVKEVPEERAKLLLAHGETLIGAVDGGAGG
jgi:exonuclease SbcD